MADLPLEGALLHYEDHGSGKPLVLLPGIASDSTSWGPLIAPLARRFHLICPDNRGSGRTVSDLASVTIPQSAADTARLIEVRGLGPVHLVGHSMGGLIALELAATRPDLVRGLTLLASAPLRSGRNQHLLETLIALRQPGHEPGLWLRAFYPWLLRAQMFQVPGIVDVAMKAALSYPHAQSAEAFAAQVAAVGAYDPKPAAARLSVPVQAILGAEDLLYPLAPTQKALMEALSGVQLFTIEGAAHSLHWDAPDRVADLITAFAAK